MCAKSFANATGGGEEPTGKSCQGKNEESPQGTILLVEEVVGETLQESLDPQQVYIEEAAGMADLLEEEKKERTWDPQEEPEGYRNGGG